MERREVGFAFMRHGKTQWNLDGRVQGSTDIPLLPESLIETRELALKLQEIELPFTRLYTSALQRTIATGDVFKEVLEIKSHHIEPKFNERGGGYLEGRTLKEIHAKGHTFEDKSVEDKLLFEKRVLDGFATAQNIQKNGYGLVVTHAAVIRVLLRECGGPKLASDGVPHNTIYILSPGKEAVVVQSIH